MGKRIEGSLNGARKRFAIVVARFNDFITKHLADGATDALVRHGVKEDDIDIVWVPGAMEIAAAAMAIARRKKVHAVICLGAVLRGATHHNELVAAQCARATASIGIETGVPAIFGVLTTETIEQAIERAGAKMGNRGAEAAVAAIEMANVMEQL